MTVTGVGLDNKKSYEDFDNAPWQTQRHQPRARARERISPPAGYRPKSCVARPKIDLAQLTVGVEKLHQEASFWLPISPLQFLLSASAKWWLPA
jgi:hypothetical protein